MSRTTVGIIGGTNGMGRWLADLLINQGCVVHVTGRKTAMTAIDAAGICDVLVVSVPIAVTADVIRQIGPLLKEDQALMDLTSLKKEPVALMLEHTDAEVIGCHPLFGPAVRKPEEHNIVLCPGRGNAWYVWVKKIFEKSGYTVLERNPADHDRMMAIVQALNHLNTVALGFAIARFGVPLAEVNLFATPVFKVKIDMIRKVFTENPEMYADIIAGNPEIGRILGIYEDVACDIRRMVADGDAATLKRAILDASRKLF